MVRENPDSGDGVDANKNVNLEQELRKADRWTGDTIDPTHSSNVKPIDIRGDMEPDKKGDDR